ncbi:hypothetical protein FRC07_001000 [Ceratobasidium sp. 392]|nr:hypothetical protein FRC07_001000 [Ceratobasidium sp. 392]
MRTSSGFHSKDHANLAVVSSSSSASFDMLSVEAIVRSSTSLAEPTTTSAATLDAPSTSARIESPATPTSTTETDPSTISTQAIQTSAKKEPLQLQAQEVTSVGRTTLIVPPTFSVHAPSSTNLGLVPTTSHVVVAGTPSGSRSGVHPTTWTRPIPTAVHTPSASASSSPTAHPQMSHPHISPALIVLMVLGGVASLGLSLYVFKRVRYKAMHVSRSQFHIATGHGTVVGSSSDQSFVSGGLGHSQPVKREKNGYLDAGAETPLWGGKEKFSPQIDSSVLDYPPAVHLADGSRAPMRHRQSMLQRMRRYSPGNRLSRSGPGWNPIPEHPSLQAVPTVKVTDMDTRHNRLDSNSTFSSALEGSPDPNLATIQVALVTRTQSAAASYRVGSPSPPPSVITGLDHPRPAPKVPTKALMVGQAPPMPRIPAVTVTSSERVLNVTGKKPLDTHGRGKIAVTDISKPQPFMPVRPESPGGNGRAPGGETDPMVMYAKYSASLGVREGSPKQEPRHESSMAKKIAQIAHGKSMIIATESQSSLSNRDTRALAAAAGVGSPIPGEDHTFRGFVKNNQQATGAPQLGVTPIASASLFPASPGLGEVGNIMLRPFGETGAMIPAFLETPAIGLDGRSSYLSTNTGPGLGSTAGPAQAIAAKGISATLEAEQSAGTLSPSMLSEDPSRRTIASTYSQEWVPLSQQAHMRQNPDYKSPTYSIYNYYGPDRVSTVPRMPNVPYGDREEPQIGGAL